MTNNIGKTVHNNLNFFKGRKMKKTLIIGGSFLLIFGFYTIISKCFSVAGAFAEQNVDSSNKISINEHPTQEEWLEVYMAHKIKQKTDLWERRIAVTITIVPTDHVIVVGLTSANGQKQISQSAKNGYIDTVEVTVKGILEKYDLVKSYKLTVQYI